MTCCCPKMTRAMLERTWARRWPRISISPASFSPESRDWNCGSLNDNGAFSNRDGWVPFGRETWDGSSDDVQPDNASKQDGCRLARRPAFDGAKVDRLRRPQHAHRPGWDLVLSRLSD